LREPPKGGFFVWSQESHRAFGQLLSMAGLPA